jgi:hypothetical protein
MPSKKSTTTAQAIRELQTLQTAWLNVKETECIVGNNAGK